MFSSIIIRIPALLVILASIRTNTVSGADASSSSSIFDQPFTQSFTKLVHVPCTTLFHRNGKVGCSTEDRSMSIGKLVYYQGALPDNEQDPFVIVLEDYDMTADNIDILAAAKGGLLKGILVVNSTIASSSSRSSSNKDSNTYYSPASQTPGGYNTPSAKLTYGNNAYQWNPKGEGLLEYNLYGVPMAYVYDSEVAASLREESQNNAQVQNSAIVAEFNYYMGPDAITSKDCLLWKDISGNTWNPKCLPLGGTSVWATAGSPPNVDYNNNNNGNRRDTEAVKDKEDHDGRTLADYANQRGVIMLSAGMDSTSMFHDLSPGANSAASNILTIVMAAKLIGANMNDQTLDQLPKRIVFALFEGESFGYIGSRAFFRDLAYPGFKCNGNPVRAVPRLGQKSDYACLYPMRPSIKFADLGPVAGMISVDQVGYAVSNGILYVHADQNNDEYGTYLANILKYSGTNDYSVAYSSAVKNNNYGFPYPPSPLTSLLSLSGGAKGGAVITGYDYAFTGHIPYHSHRDSAATTSISLKSIAAAATIVARAAVAAAYDDGSNDYGGYANSAKYAKNIIPELSYNDDDLVELSNCLFYGNSCNIISKYSEVETANEKVRTGLNIGYGDPFPNPPSFYVGVYNSYYGQPFVQVGDSAYGAYNGDDFGKKNSDAFAMMPRQLESAIHGMFNDYLGRGSNANGNNNYVSCKKASDCAKVDNICLANGDSTTCTGRGQCVCKRSNYHIALDEALEAAPNEATGYFQISENDQEISAIYTEPYWSSNVGIRVYRNVGALPGFVTLAVGLGLCAASMFSALVLKVGLKKEKLY